MIYYLSDGLYLGLKYMYMSYEINYIYLNYIHIVYLCIICSLKTFIFITITIQNIIITFLINSKKKENIYLHNKILFGIQ